MSFAIKHFINLSATNVVNKELEPQVPDLMGTLRKGSSIIDPVIEVQASSPGFHANKSNYIYIEEFGRYYYITNIISTHNSLWELHCHVDVLMSFAELIKQQVAVVARQESTYNMMLDDGFFMCYQNPRIQTKLFSNETPFETQEFVLVVAGSSTSSSTASSTSSSKSNSATTSQSEDTDTENNNTVQSS